MEVSAAMGNFNTVFSKKDLPTRWEEISRNDNGTQLSIRLGHIDPGNKADKVMTSGMPIAMVDGQAVTVHGISKPNTMTEFFNAMTAMAQSGFAPGMKPEDINALRSQYNTLKNERYDVELDISIADLGSEAGAIEALENLDPTHPRTVGGKSLAEVFSDPRMAAYLTAEQLKAISDLPAQMAKLQNEVKSQSEGRYFQDQFLGCPALFFETDNPAYQEYIKPKPVIKRDPKKFQGGGIDPKAKPRPKAAPPSPKILNCYGVRIGNVLISGSLVNGAIIYPSGQEYQQSLTKHETVVETEKVEGHTYSTTHLLPVDSTLAAEGYVNREEVTQMLQTIINQIKTTA
jgi:hypothetical protein